MPSIDAILNARTLPVLRPWATTGGMVDANKSKKAQVIAFLTTHPDSIPLEVRALADPIVPIVPNNNPGPQVSLADFRALLTEAIVPLSERIAALEARPMGQARQPTLSPPQQGEIEEVPFAETPLVSAAAQARAFLPNVPEDVLSLVLQNKLQVKDFHRLDPTRANSLAGPSEESAFSQFARSFMPSSDGNIVEEAKGKYPDLDSILRPWLVYSQICDIVSPGKARYLIGHASELMRLAKLPATYFSGILTYHLYTATRRLNLGDALDMRVWLEPDPVCIATWFTPYNVPPPQQPAASASASSSALTRKGQPTRPQQRSAGPTAGWDKNSVGNLTSSLPCHSWNDMKPCASKPCNFRHFCRTCKQPGHPRGDPVCSGGKT